MLPMIESPKGDSVQSKERALAVAVLTTFLSLLPTAYAAFSSNSLVLAADFLRCAVEFGAIFLSWRIFQRIARGDRSNYDYGFGKLEQAASVTVAGALGVSFLIVTILSLSRLQQPAPVENAVFGFFLGLLSVAGNSLMWIYNYRLARDHSSPIFDSQWRLFRAKTAASAVVILALLPTVGGFPSHWTQYTDPLGSLLVAGFLLVSAIKMLSSSMEDLLDRSLEEGLRLLIFGVLIRYEADYQGLSLVRSRRSGNRIYIDIALEFSGELKFAVIGAVIERIRKELADAIPGSEITIASQLFRAPGDSG